MEVLKHNHLPLIPLNKVEAHIWFAFPLEINDAQTLQAYYSLMNEEERKRQKRYYFKEDRHNCLVTRALVRSILSRYVKKSPEEWQFSKNRYGRPRIRGKKSTLPLQFNLSHTDGLIACIITKQNDIGIDVENLKNRNVNLQVADRFFSPLEVSDLHMLPGPKRRSRFLEYWTLKESYIKACGKGLSIPLDQFSFIFSKNGSLSIEFDKKNGDDAGNWQFFRMNPTNQHKAAVAIRKNHLTEFQITVRKTVPLVSEELYPCKILG